MWRLGILPGAPVQGADAKNRAESSLGKLIQPVRRAGTLIAAALRLAFLWPPFGYDF